jgi:CRP-like cAMP-binding protein
VLGSGQVEIVVNDGALERRVNTLNEGDYFGEMALLADEPRAATARTTMATQLYSLSRADLASLLEREPEARRAIGERIAARGRALAQARAATRIAPVQLRTPQS